jgi:hypothetical protein
MPLDEMEFVHANGFFAVSKSKEQMDNYIKNYRE